MSDFVNQVDYAVSYQKGHSQIILAKSTWLYGLRMPWQPRHLTGSYCRLVIASTRRSGVTITPSGITILFASILLRGHTFQANRVPSYASKVAYCGSAITAPTLRQCHAYSVCESQRSWLVGRHWRFAKHAHHACHACQEACQCASGVAKHCSSTLWPKKCYNKASIACKASCSCGSNSKISVARAMRMLSSDHRG